METILFAFTAILAENPPPAGDAGGGAPFIYNLPFFIAIGVMAWLIIFRPMNRERKRQAELLSAIKKNDRVLTTAGILGVVTNVNKEANEVTLRIDESTNAKIRLTLSSVVQVLGDEPSADTPSK